MSIYLIENKTMPWGDWGDILWSGMLSWDASTDHFLIDRIGPYTPHLYLTDNGMVCTHSTKENYKRSKLKGLSINEKITKRKIVNIDWSTWDRSLDISHHIDIPSEPENIIINGNHDPQLLQRMPNYWFAEITNHINIIIDKTTKEKSRRYRIKGLYNPHVDFFTGVEYRGVFVSDRAKSWLDKNFPEHFEYYEIHP